MKPSLLPLSCPSHVMSPPPFCMWSQKLRCHCKDGEEGDREDDDDEDVDDGDVDDNDDD